MQSEILDYLRTQKKYWRNSTEISQALGIRKQVALDGLKKLRRFGLIKWENNGHSYIYQYNDGIDREKKSRREKKAMKK